MKRIIRVIALILMLSFVFDLAGASVNPTITVEAKKKKKNYLKEWSVKIGNRKIWVNKYSKNFVKYVHPSENGSLPLFKYDGTDKVIHIPLGVQINEFAPGYSHNNTIEKIVFYGAISEWAEGQFFFDRYLSDEENDYEYYSCFYQCDALKKVKFNYTKYTFKWAKASSDGKELYIEYKGGYKRILWRYGERVPA